MAAYFSRPEIDILVSKLLGFDTFANFFRVSVSKNLVLEKKFWFQKILSQKNLGFGFKKLGLRKEKIKVTRKNLDQVNSPSLKFEF